jgi:predicted dehydrogenase
MSRLRMVVVGTGALGRHHARILSQNPYVKLVAVADCNVDSAKSVAEACHSRWVTDHRELLLAEQIDAAVIAVPTFAHLDVAADFLRRRIPVLVEKPLAANFDQARQLVEIAEQRETLLQVGHIERFNPAFQVAAPLIHDPKYIRTERYSPYAFRSTDIGVVHDVLIHDLDLVLQLVRSPLRRDDGVEAFGITILGGHEDCVQARLRFENGCIADLSANRVCPETKRVMQAWSPGGCVQVDFVKRDVIGYRPNELLNLETSPVELARQPGASLEQLKQDVFGKFLAIEHPAIPGGDQLTAELASFIDCVTKSRPAIVSGSQALEVMRVADLILKSVDRHSWNGMNLGPTGPNVLQPRQLRLAG